MRRLYTFFLYLAIPLILLRLFWKGRKLGSYQKRINERFMRGLQPAQVDLWLHAVSLGEVVAATPLIKALLDQGFSCLITTMTPTGSQRVIEQFGETVQHQYLPYDLPLILRLFFKQYAPRLGLIMETELWPNLIHQAHLAKTPVLLINARISDRAFKRYRQLKFFFKPVLRELSGVMAQSKIDAQRFAALGVCKERLSQCGNLKFDMPATVAATAIADKIQSLWGPQKTMLMVASTHANEEEQLLKRFVTLQSSIADLVFLIAPRHPERFQEVYRLSRALGFNTVLRSQLHEINSDTQVLIIDTLGELKQFYLISDYAFVGGSLVPVGGHNVLEPIAANVPVFCGPHIQNIRSICKDLLKKRAICIAQDADSLIKEIIKLHQNQIQRGEQVDNASDFLRSSHGSLQRYLQKIEYFLQDS